MTYCFVKYGRATAFHTYLAKMSAIIQEFLFYGFYFFVRFIGYSIHVVLGCLEGHIEKFTLYLYGMISG